MKFLLILLLIVAAPVKADPGSVDAVFNRALETRTISRVDARNLYLLKDRSLNRMAVTVFRFPLRDQLHAEFVRDILDMQPAEFEAAWSRLVNTGLAPQIKEVRSVEEMKLSISKTYGGIGYLNHNFMVLHGGGDAVIVRITP